MSTTNKVKFNIRNVYFSKLTIADDGSTTYGTPVAMPGAVSLSLEPNGEPSVFYADGYAYYTISNNQGYEGDLELALVPEAFRTEILKETMDNNSVLIEDATKETEKFALLFEFDGDKNKIRHVLYNCTASRPNIESATNEDEIEVKTETITITASPLSGGVVKARTSDTTSEEVYNNWFKTVYTPAGTSFSVSPTTLSLVQGESGNATLTGKRGNVTSNVTIEGETTGMVTATISGNNVSISAGDTATEGTYVVTLTDDGRTTGNVATISVTVTGE